MPDLRRVSPAVFGSIALALAAGATPAIAARRPHRPSSAVNGSVSGADHVKVTVAGVGSTHTNKAGFFSIKGKKLSGIHTIVFTQGKHTYRTTINVPAGATVSLQSVTFSSNGSADPGEEDLTVDGTLSAVNCTSTPNTVTITPKDGGTAVTMTFDTSTTHIVDESNGTVITSCDTLANNYLSAPAEAEGQQASDGSIAASNITLNPTSEDAQDVNFDGTVQSENCPNSIVVQRSDGSDVTVDLTSQTEISIEDSESDSNGACSDIPASAFVHIEGTSNSDGSVTAASVHVKSNEFDSAGTIGATDCSASPQSFSFTPDGAASALTVTIGATTEIEVNDNSAASCGDLTAAPAHVEGVVQSDGSVAATRIEQNAGGGD